MTTGRSVLLILLGAFTVTTGACLGWWVVTRRPAAERRDLGDRDAADSDIQAKRKADIREYTRRGVFAEVLYGDYPTIVTGPLFWRVDQATRDHACMLVAKYQFRIPEGRSMGKEEVVLIKDKSTGKQVGMVTGAGVLVVDPKDVPDLGP